MGIVLNRFCIVFLFLICSITAQAQSQWAKQYEQANSGVKLAEHLFFSAETEEQKMIIEEDGSECYFMEPITVYFHPEAALKAAENARTFILGWNNPDYAELGLIADDIDCLTECVNRWETMSEGAYEGSRDYDNKAATGADIGAGNHEENVTDLKAA